MELIDEAIEHVDHAGDEVERIRRQLRNEIAVRRMVMEKKLVVGARGPEEPTARQRRRRRSACRSGCGPSDGIRAAARGLILNEPTAVGMRAAMCRRVGQIWMKGWDEVENRWYYRNDLTKEVTWDKSRVPVIDFHEGEDAFSSR